MFNSTLCYIEKDGKYLMLFRNKKEKDPCEGKYVGIGGKFEPGENAEQCVMREVFEETGIHLTKKKFIGVIHFFSDVLDSEDMYLYHATEYEGEISECNEGTLSWVKKEDVLKLNLWEGDPYFLEKLIRGDEKIEMTCRYEGDRIVEVIDDLTGEKLL